MSRKKIKKIGHVYIKKKCKRKKMELKDIKSALENAALPLPLDALLLRLITVKEDEKQIVVEEKKNNKNTFPHLHAREFWDSFFTLLRCRAERMPDKFFTLINLCTGTTGKCIPDSAPL